jgi:hypothetical protein
MAQNEKKDQLQKFISYFPHYPTEALEQFVKNNNLVIDWKREDIKDLERENEAISAEIERRKNTVSKVSDGTD